MNRPNRPDSPPTTRATTSRGSRRVTKAAIRQPAAIFGSMLVNNSRSLVRIERNFSVPSRRYTTAPAVSASVRMTAVDHSNDLIRRRSAMKSGALSGKSALHPAGWAQRVQAELPHTRNARVPLTALTATASVRGDGDGVPRNRPERLMTPTAQTWRGSQFRTAAGRYFIALERKGTSMRYLIVFLGGGVGAALRHGVNVVAARLLGTAFPYATTIENVTGSLLMGLLAGSFAFRGGISQHWQLFLTTGILGGYTTFSTFSLDAALLYERGALGLAALYVILSLLLSVGGLFVGLWIMRHA